MLPGYDDFKKVMYYMWWVPRDRVKLFYQSMDMTALHQRNLSNDYFFHRTHSLHMKIMVLLWPMWKYVCLHSLGLVFRGISKVAQWNFQLIHWWVGRLSVQTQCTVPFLPTSILVLVWQDLGREPPKLHCIQIILNQQALQLKVLCTDVNQELNSDCTFAKTQ